MNALMFSLHKLHSPKSLLLSLVSTILFNLDLSWLGRDKALVFCGRLGTVSSFFMGFNFEGGQVLLCDFSALVVSGILQ